MARLQGSRLMCERGWVWIWGRRDLLTDNSPQPPPCTGSSSNDIAASMGAMCLTLPLRTYTRVRLIIVSMKHGSDVSGTTSILSQIDICADPWNAAYVQVVCILYVWQAALYRRCTANKTTPRMPRNAPRSILSFKIFLGKH